MSRTPPPHRGARRAQSGVVMLELLIAFVPLFVLFLGAVQLGLLGAAKLVVQHAAIAGARSAAVVLDDDPAAYDGCARWAIEDAPRDPQLNGSARSGAPNSSDGTPSPEPSPRMALIARAVYAPLTAIAPDPDFVRGLGAGRTPAPSIATALGTPTVEALRRGAESYLPLATAIVFPLQPHADTVARGRVEPGERVDVRVTYLAPCEVPVARRLACMRLPWDARHARLDPKRAGNPELRRALRELQTAPSAARQAHLQRADVPVAVLWAEASFPAQRAAYRYAAERDSPDEAVP